jgi:hypothetical protein
MDVQAILNDKQLKIKAKTEIISTKLPINSICNREEKSSVNKIYLAALKSITQ